uniref:Uncharacterized protein n=1 Tax=Octopus bimaculoides TaxID=37653 RepID=A0A0L8FQK1_OCTBM
MINPTTKNRFRWSHEKKKKRKGNRIILEVQNILLLPLWNNKLDVIKLFKLISTIFVPDSFISIYSLCIIFLEIFG